MLEIQTTRRKSMIKSGEKVCFITPPAGDKSVIRDYAGGLGFEANSGYILPPLDNLQLAACIQNTFRVSVIDAQAEKINIRQLILKLKKKEIKLVIFEISVPTLKSDVYIAEQIAKNDIFVIGRVHTKETSILNSILSEGYIGFCLTGECDDNLGRILLGQEKSGTAWFENNKVKIYPKSFVQDLDSLPFPLRDLVLKNPYYYPKLGECTTLLSSRGCPYSCKYYCPYPLTQGEKWRPRSSSSVIDELRDIRDLGIHRVLFRDAVFTLDKNRVEKICQGMRKYNLKIEWWCETRADLLPDDLLELMAESGCKGINVGVESGDPKLRFAKLKRGVSDDILFRVSQKTLALNIKLSFLLMVGFPGETRKSVLRTARLIQRCRPYGIGINFPVQHPGTKLEKDSSHFNWILKEDYQLTDGSIPVIVGPGLSQVEMLKGRNILLSFFEAIKCKNYILEEKIMKKIQIWVKGVKT